jgi:subtilase family serine protease
MTMNPQKLKLLKQPTILLFTTVIVLCAFRAHAENIDPDGTGCKYAWAENVGWINFKPSRGPGVTVTDTAVTGMAWGENIGWINMSPANGNGGVVNDGAGTLSGFAWAENVGWINFNPTGGGVSIGSDGKFTGYAWGENIGWINFSSRYSFVKTAWVPKPDLVETSVSNPPENAAPGSSFSVTDTVRNQSNGHAGASTTSYYFSLDATKNDSDILLTGTRSVPALGAGGTSSGTVSVTIPGGTAIGAYYLLACADDAGLVAESDETNNCMASGAMTTVKMGPDLIETSVSNPPASATPGSRFSITETAKNQGSVGAGASGTRYYLSVDPMKSGDDILLTRARPVPRLAPGATSTATVTVTIPTNTTLGNYYLLACVDDLNVVTEVNETNNCIASASPMKIAKPDLMAVSMSNPPASAARGSSFSVTDRVKNQGDANAGASTTRYYLSIDQGKGVGDVSLAGSRPVPQLTPGATSEGTVQVTVKGNTPLGTYYLLACSDDTMRVEESDETNNCIASGSTVTVTR